MIAILNLPIVVQLTVRKLLNIGSKVHLRRFVPHFEIGNLAVSTQFLEAATWVNRHSDLDQPTGARLEDVNVAASG